jgi:hypothetical protein
MYVIILHRENYFKEIRHTILLFSNIIKIKTPVGGRGQCEGHSIDRESPELSHTFLVFDFLCTS